MLCLDYRQSFAANISRAGNGFALTYLREENNSRLTAEDLAAIEKIHSRWLQEELAENVPGMVELCDEGVMLLPPNSKRVAGKEALERFLESGNVRVKDVRITDVAIQGSGSVAYLTSNYSSDYELPGASVVRQAEGGRLWILRRAAGSWRIAVVSWSWVDTP